ncbi:MAG: hypothetical protein K0U98_18360 [Deltaproteobacteria bacterium]|nr:hypothetical protein [Deltaproteobacteria bacterium]
MRASPLALAPRVPWARVLSPWVPSPSSPRSWLLLGALWIALGGAASSFASSQPVALEVNPAGDLILAQLPAVLDHTTVAPKLTSGLTTTFYFRVAVGRRDEALGGADISLRYDVWEEVFLLTIRDGLGTTQTQQQPPDQLEEWWSNLRVALAPWRPSEPNSDSPDQPLEMIVSLTVLPYSSGELADTKRWLSRTGATGRQRPPDPGDRAQTSSHLFDLLLGTSLERKALFSRKWTTHVLPPPSLEGSP